MGMHPLLKRTRWTRGQQGPPPPIASLDWDELGIPDSWDWLAKPPSWAWHRLAIDGYSDWDQVGATERADSRLSKAPPFVMVECTRERAPESEEMANSFDDVATGLFYYRDWTHDGIPWCNAGEVYWSGFWFQRIADALAFQASYGGAGSWQADFEERRAEMVAKREAS